MRGQLAAYFEAAFTAPNGVKRLRELILTLAVQGKLTEQRESDEPASELLKKIAAEKKKLEKEGKIKKQKPLPPVGEGEKPYALPNGWEWCRFQDFILEIATGPFGSVLHKNDYVENGTPLINPSHMNNGIIMPDSRVAVTAATAKKLASYRLNTGDIVMARRGELGRCAVVDSASDGYLCGTGSFILRKSKMMFLQFLILLFQCPTVRSYLLGNSVGTTMTNLNHGILIKMPISLPPLAEQQRIVERVNALLAQCDALEAMHKEQENKRTSARAAAMHALTMPQGNTDPAFAFSRNWGFLARHFEQLFTTKQDVAELRKTILQLAVMGKLTEQCESDEPASELLKKIAAEKKKLEKEGKIKKQKPLPPVGDGEKPYALPNGWEWVRLGDAGALERGKSKHRPRNDKKKFENGDIPFVQTGDVSKAKLSNSTILTCTGYYNALGLAQSQLQSKGVLCITIAANIAETGFLGFDACVPDSIVIFIDTNGAISSYVKIFIDTAKNHLEKYAPSTAQKNINLEILNLLAFPLPPLAEQQRIVERVNALMALCDTLEQNIDARAQTQTRLLDAVAAIA